MALPVATPAWRLGSRERFLQDALKLIAVRNAPVVLAPGALGSIEVEIIVGDVMVGAYLVSSKS
jgi:hypothetical protein